MVGGVPQLDRQGSPTKRASLSDDPRYAAVIGINAYANGITPLQTAVHDAQTVASCLEKDHGYRVDLLLDDQATLVDLQDLIEERLHGELAEDSTFLLYFAGHAFADGDAEDPKGYFFPQDSQKGVESSWLPMDALSSALEKLPCKHLLLILDCCFAGSFRWASSRAIVPVGKRLYDQQFERFRNGDAWHLLTSSAHNETAVDMLSSPETAATTDDETEAQETLHSPFAAALLDGLSGEADSERSGFEPDGVITVTELHQYIYSRLGSARETRFQTPGLSNLKRANRGEFVFLAPGKKKNTRPSPPLDENDNPWLGLAAYSRDDDQKFFGRSEVVEDLLQRVQGRDIVPNSRDRFKEITGGYARWVVVIGASGSGKSSLVRAGLIPKLSSGPEPWHAVEMGRLNSDRPEALLDRAEAELAAAGDGPKLLVIDQFEEIFTQNTADSRGPFITRLIECVETSPDLRMVITVRSDFEPQLRSRAAFGRYISRCFFPVPPPSDLELRQIVEGPAGLKDLYFEPPELVGQITQDVLTMPGALPMISFALAEMFRAAWQRRFAEGHSRAITQEDFDDIGGVVGSLHNCANSLWDGASESKKRMIQWVFLRMVSEEGGRLSRRRVIAEELKRSDPDENLVVEEVLKEYTAARLLIRDDGYYEPGHDALVVAWPKLLGWLETSSTQPLLRALWNSARAWQAEPSKSAKRGLLWTENPRLSLVANLSSRLQRLREFLSDRAARQQIRNAGKQREDRLRQLNYLERRFVTASVRELRKRRARAFVYRRVVSAIIVLLAIYAWHQRNEFQRIADIAKTRLQLATSASLLDQEETALAALVALELENPRDEAGAARLLHQVLFDHVPKRGILASRDTTQDPNAQTLWNSDGSRVLVAGRSGQMHIWYPHQQDRGLTQVTPSLSADSSADFFRAVAWSPDGRRIAAITRDANLLFFHEQDSDQWSADPPLSLVGSTEGPCEPNDFTTLSWHPKDPKLFVVYQGEPPRIVWDSDEKKSRSLAQGIADPILSARWDDQGKRLLIVSEGSVARWNPEKEKADTERFHPQAILAGVWDPQGRRVLIASSRSASLWNAEQDRLTELISDPKTPAPIEPEPAETLGLVAGPTHSKDFEQVVDASPHGFSTAAWSPDGTRLLWIWRDEALLWDTSRDRELGRLKLKRREVSRLAWAPVGHRLLEISGDSASIWDTEKHVGVAALELSSPIKTAFWSSDSTRILLASDDSIDIWPVAPRVLQAILRQEIESCLTPQEREQYLQEPPQEADAKAEACDRCTPRFFETLDSESSTDAAGSKLTQLSLAWEGYRLCLQQPVETPWARNGAEQIESSPSATEGEEPDQICRVRYQRDVIPGQWQLHEDRVECLFAPPSVGDFQTPEREFEILTGRYRWTPEFEELGPAVVGGRQGTQPLYICRGRLEDQLQIGKWIDGACWGGQRVVSGALHKPTAALGSVQIEQELEILNHAESGWLTWVSQWLESD